MAAQPEPGAGLDSRPSPRASVRAAALACVTLQWCVARQVAAAGDEGEAVGDEGDEGEAAKMRGVLCAAVGIMASALPAWKKKAPAVARTLSGGGGEGARTLQRRSATPCRYSTMFLSSVPSK